MSAKYVPAVGDMVRPGWLPNAITRKVTAVGEFNFLTIAPSGTYEECWKIKDDWIQVVQPEPLTETWIAVGERGNRAVSATSFETAVAAYERLLGSGQVGLSVIHAWTDADGDHAEIERVTK